jgi:hypothetical protein
VAHITPAIEAAVAAAKALDSADMPHDVRPVTAADFELVQRMQRETQQQDETAEDRFRRAIRLLADTDVDQVNAQWLKSYRTTHEFTGRWMVFEEFGGAAFGLGITYDHLCQPAQHYGERK